MTLLKNQYIIINAENVTITGGDTDNKNIITLADGHGGLIENGTNDTNDTAKTCTIQNIKVQCDGSLKNYGGGICREYFGSGLKDGNILIDNCHFESGTIGVEGGGICGSYCGIKMTGGSLTIQKCTNEGTIGKYAGGICGYMCGYSMRKNASLIIQNCSNEGNIQFNAGGICGYRCG